MTQTITPDAFRATQKAQWGAVAAGWERWNDWYDAAFRPLSEWCCDAAALGPGQRVLDIACGTGHPALDAAARVGPTGAVVAIDIAPEMLAVATRRATQAGYRWMTCREMDAERLDLPDAWADAVTCACAFMFFPEPERALAEVRRVLKPGGRLAIGVWDEAARCPFLTSFGIALAQVAPGPPPDPSAPGPFRYAAPGALAATLEQAGFTGVTIESRPMPIACESVDHYWAVVTDHAAGLKSRLSTLSRTQLTRVRHIVEETLAPYAQPDGHLELVATPLCASAAR